MIDRRPAGSAVLSGRSVPADSLELAWADPAAQWGLGIFETVAVRRGTLLSLDPHLDRLAAAASRFGVPLPSRRELQRQRGSVESLADLGRCFQLAVVQRTTGSRTGHPLRKEYAGRAGQHLGGVCGDLQRAEPEQRLARNLEWLAARAQEVERRALLRERFDQLGGTPQDVLAIVEHEQGPA